ncbi:MAG: hypothetical protein QXM52_02160 [Candidatus Bathyarchaeia archaeon]
MNLEETKREIEAFVLAKVFYNSRENIPRSFFSRLPSWMRRLTLGKRFKRRKHCRRVK